MAGLKLTSSGFFLELQSLQACALHSSCHGKVSYHPLVFADRLRAPNNALPSRGVGCQYLGESLGKPTEQLTLLQCERKVFDHDTHFDLTLLTLICRFILKEKRTLGIRHGSVVWLGVWLGLDTFFHFNQFIILPFSDF